jgi:type IV secretion system protein VirB9
MKLLPMIVALVLVGSGVPATWAEVLPPKGNTDGRVRVVDYDPMNVIRLVTQFGVSTHVEFPEEELVQDVAVGDDQAWKLVPRRNHLFIKPVAEKADTNVTVVTSKHTYNFALTVKSQNGTADASWSDADLIYTLYFRYPGEERKKKEAAKKEKIQKEKEAVVKAELEQKGPIRNIHYFRQGSDLIAPVEAWDDGRFTYLTFAQVQDIPAVYLEDDDGKEALVNTTFQDRSTIVIHRVVPRLIIRQGDQVARIENRSFTTEQKWTETGTTSPTIQRVEKTGGPT